MVGLLFDTKIQHPASFARRPGNDFFFQYKFACLSLFYVPLNWNAHTHVYNKDDVEYDIAALPGSVNIPWKKLSRRLGDVLDLIGEKEEGTEQAQSEKAVGDNKEGNAAFMPGEFEI